MVRDTDRRKFLIGTAGLGVTGLAGCLGNGDDDGDEPEPGDGGDGDGGDTGDAARDIMYGVLQPETGDLGSLGGPMRDGALLPARQLEGETSFTIDTQVEDTQTDPQAGISGANQLVNAGYPAVVGPAASNVNLQVTQQVFIPEQVVGISPSSTAPSVTDLDDDGYIFRTAPSDALQGPVMAQVIAEELDASTAGTLYLNDDYGQALEESFANAFEDEQGGQVVNRVSFEPEQASYNSQLGEALNDNPDVLMVVGFPQSGITLFRDFYNNYDDDWDGDIIVPDGLIDSDLPGEVGNDMENVWGTEPSAAGPGAEFFADLYEQEYERAPGVFNSHAYDAAAVVILANAYAGTNDGTAVRDAMREVANPEGTPVTPENLAEGVEMAANGEDVFYQGASSPVNFDENGDIEGAAYDIVRYEGGGITVYDTVEFGE